MPRVMCAGHVNWDVTLRLDALPEPDGEARIVSQRGAGGGSAANVAVAVTELDVSAGLIGSVGADQHGLLVRRELADVGVDLDGLREVDGSTTVKYLLVTDSGEVMVLGNEGANEAITPTDIDPASIRGVDHLHLTSQRPATATRLAEFAVDTDTTVSVDPGRRLERDFSGPLERADLVFLNDREASEILDSTADDAGRFDDTIVIVKHGDAGGEVRTSDGTYTHPGFDVAAVDTTGAGDAFAAGFIVATLADAGYDRALAFANACGALTSLTEGARASLTRADVESFLGERASS